MDKLAIADLIEEKYQVLFDWLNQQPAENWETGPEGKWTTSQHILHLVNSLQLLNNALSYPRFFLKYKFGLSNRPSRSYEEVVKKYQDKLVENLDKSIEFNKDLKSPLLKDKPRLMTRLQIQHKKLQYKTRKISDVNLDTLVIPHPLMGKMTVRELIMWAAYHTEHHTTILKNLY
ncbi:DinB family protein [Polaribacter sp. BAL334]|uniref:DinB family protein n=1 Tax=Polaribacter sp. BAL334 TaxID=1708178 RepID=UPI0018D20DC2|nr:DinB family protein [Polaribacter sp. BAL334]MBG7613322.1 DinB family protein [Polaribacter sp. BAL334]